MTDHYFADKPQSKEDIFEYKVKINEVDFRFYSDSGVFSKQGIDYGSRLLIDSILLDADKLENGLPSELKPSLSDLGCGVGVIGIILNRLLKINNSYLYDINERAVALAKINIDRNMSKRTYVKKLDITKDSILEKVDICVTNPPIRAGKAVVFAFYEKAYEMLNDGGVFYCVIQKKQGLDSTKKKLSELFPNVDTINRSSGYHILKCIK
ncbi:MAG TPA: methyltransferase [Clostridia bacterium]|jgi:16S rRNA (guanine1207-N2)-methyltransferase|nr:MAG: Ribosomal RNA large subunit methyltransferase G [Firmicutes bacterium ADurb.Bin146]HOD93145.1 methyltransferase [Clostridia bacterium]HQM39058.1 methyltransferase [Clostridia bacterium]